MRAAPTVARMYFSFMSTPRTWNISLELWFGNITIQTTKPVCLQIKGHRGFPSWAISWREGQGGWYCVRIHLQPQTPLLSAMSRCLSAGSLSCPLAAVCPSRKASPGDPPPRRGPLLGSLLCCTRSEHLFWNSACFCLCDLNIF